MDYSAVFIISSANKKNEQTVSMIISGLLECPFNVSPIPQTKMQSLEINA